MPLEHFASIYSAPAGTSLPPITDYHLDFTAAIQSNQLSENLILGGARSSFFAGRGVDLYTKNKEVQGRRELSKS